jgi:hypothetical protein
MEAERDGERWREIKTKQNREKERETKAEELCSPESPDPGRLARAGQECSLRQG